MPKAPLALGDGGVSARFPRQGTHSVGVARQYCGPLGKQDNCQVAVRLSLANDHASLPGAYRLYLPKGWADDEERRRKAGVPADISSNPSQKSLWSKCAGRAKPAATWCRQPSKPIKRADFALQSEGPPYPLVPIAFGGLDSSTLSKKSWLLDP
jgi:hypothetical protein